MKKLLVILLALAGSSRAAPASYDQRQDGEMNVKVDLDNFLILVARPSSGFDIMSSIAQVYGDLKRTSGSTQISAQEGPELNESALERSEDVAKVNLEDVSLVVESKPSEEEKPEKIIVAVQEGEKTARILEDVARTMKNFKGKESMLEKTRGISGKYKFVESVDEPQNLKLIGDAVENCGPGRSRDRLGICQSDGLGRD